VVTAYFVDERRWSRKQAVWAIGGVTFVVGLPSVLSQGANETLSTMSLAGNTSFLFIMDHLWGNVSLAIGALLLSIFIGWVWGVDEAGAELKRGSAFGETSVRIWGFFVRWICPVVIFVVLLNVFGVV
jgi:NSS family neurotransmitter:Na+ symporter